MIYLEGHWKWIRFFLVFEKSSSRNRKNVLDKGKAKEELQDILTPLQFDMTQNNRADFSSKDKFLFSFHEGLKAIDQQ